MRRDGSDRAFSWRVERLQLETVSAKGAKHTITGAARCAGDCCTFQNLPQMQRKPDIKSVHHRESSKHGRIVRAARKNDIGIVLQRTDDWLDPKLRNDMLALLYVTLRELGRAGT